MQIGKGWLAVCAVAIGLWVPARAAGLTVDATTGLPEDANYVETKGVTSSGFTSQTVSQGTRFLLGNGNGYSGSSYSFDAEGHPLRLTTGTYAEGVATIDFSGSTEFSKPIRAASLYLEGGRFVFKSANLLKQAGPVYLKGHIYTNQTSFGNDFFISPSNYMESDQPALTYASLRIDANTTLSGTVTLLPKVEEDALNCVRFSSHSALLKLKIATLDLTRVAADGATVLDLQRVALDVDTVKLPADFSGTLTCSVANGGTLRSVGKVLLGNTELEDAKWALFENVLKVQSIACATAESEAVAFPAEVSWAEENVPTFDNTEMASLTLTQNNSVVTLDPTKPLVGLKLVAGSEAVTTVTLAVPQALPYPINWGALNRTVRLTAPAGTVTSTSAYHTVLAAAEPVTEALTLTPNGGTLTVENGTYSQTILNNNGTQTSLNFAGGELTLAGQFGFGKATVNVSGGTINAKRLVTADNNGKDTTYTQTGGDITLSQADNGSDYQDAAILLGHWLNAPRSTHTLSGGSLKAENGTLRLGQDSPATLTLQGTAVLTVKGITSNKSGSELNLEGGELRVGAWGVQNTFGFNLKGGRYVATASHTLATPVVAAAGTTSTLVAEAEQTLTVSGALSGAGALVLDGEGTVDVRSAQGFTGTLALKQGALKVGSNYLGQLTEVAEGTTLHIVAPSLEALTLPTGLSSEGITFTINGCPSQATVADDGTVTVTPTPNRYTLTLPAGETLLSAATLLNAAGVQTALADLVEPAQVIVSAAEDATLVADAEATVANVRFEVAQGKTLTLKVAEGAAALPLATPNTEVSGNLCAIGPAGALGAVYVEDGGAFAWQTSATTGAPERVFGPGTFRVLPNGARWNAQDGIGVNTFVDGINENALGCFVLDGGAASIRAKFTLPAETRLEMRNNAEYWPNGTTLNSPVTVTGSVKEANTWNSEGFGFLRKNAQTFNKPVTIDTGGEAMLGDNTNTTYSFNETVSGPGTLIAGPWYDRYTTDIALKKALPEGTTLGGFILRNTGRDTGATGVTTVTAAQDTLRGAAVSFTYGHGSTQPNVSWLTVTGNNTVASLTSDAGGGNLFIAPGVTLEAQEASSVSGAFALGGVGTLKAQSLAVRGTLQNATRKAHTARYVRWNLKARCPSGPNSGAYALAEIGLQHQGQAVSLSAATVSASSASSSHSVNCLKDGSLGTNNKWMTADGNPCWVKLDAGSGRTFTFDSYRLAMADQTGRNPRKWDVQISNDNTNWTTIDEKDYPEQEAMDWCLPNSWVPFDFYPIGITIETTEGLTVQNGGTLVYEACRLRGDLLCEAGATLRLTALPLTIEGGTLSASGTATLALPDGATEGDLAVACAGATEASAANLATDNSDLKVVAAADGYRLAKNVTLQTADGAALPQMEALVNVAYAAGLRGPVTVKAASTSGTEAKAPVADLLTCFTGLAAEADTETNTLTVVCDFGITRAAAKAVEGVEGLCLVVEAQVQTAQPTEGEMVANAVAFAEGTAVSLTLDPAPSADVVEVTGWDAATPGAAQGNARYFRLPLHALTPTTKLTVRATK